MKHETIHPSSGLVGTILTPFRCRDGTYQTEITIRWENGTFSRHEVRYVRTIHKPESETATSETVDTMNDQVELQEEN